MLAETNKSSNASLIVKPPHNQFHGDACSLGLFIVTTGEYIGASLYTFTV